MQLKLSDISPGDIIEHESWGCNHGGMRERLTRRKGKIIQVTDKVITLQGKNYPETILVNDLLSGRAKILKVKMRGEDDMARVRKDKEKIMAKARPMLAEGLSIKKTAKELDVPTTTLFQWIKKEEEQQTQPPEPEELGGTDPVQEEKEPAENSIPYSVERLENLGREINPDDDTKVYTPERQNYTITQYNEQVKQGGFTAADEEPIPYTVVDEQLSPLASAGNQILVAAWEKITAVVDDPVALPLIKELIRSGVA